MMFNLRSFLALTAMAIALCACAASPDMPRTLAQKLETRNLTVGEQVNRIRNYRLNSWNYLDDRHVILSVGASDQYLVSLRNSCRELSSATHIAFTTTVGSLSVHDKLLVTSPGGYIDRCFIESLNRLEKGSSKP